MGADDAHDRSARLAPDREAAREHVDVVAVLVPQPELAFVGALAARARSSFSSIGARLVVGMQQALPGADVRLDLVVRRSRASASIAPEYTTASVSRFQSQTPSCAPAKASVSRSSLSRSAASARLRSVMSRTMIWTSCPPSPGPSSSREPAISTCLSGLSLSDASAREIRASTGGALCPAIHRSMFSPRRLRLSGCTKSSSDRPSNSSGADAPQSRTAAGLRKVMRNSRLMKMASGACSTRRQYCSDITSILPSPLPQLREHRVGLLKLKTSGSRRAWRTSFRPPAVVGFERVHHVVLRLALFDHVQRDECAWSRRLPGTARRRLSSRPGRGRG